MSKYEIICCLRELVKNAASADGINPKITIINDVRPDSFTFVLEEAIHEIEKSIIFEDKTCTTKKDFGTTTSTNKADFDDIWDF